MGELVGLNFQNRNGFVPPYQARQLTTPRPPPPHGAPGECHAGCGLQHRPGGAMSWTDALLLGGLLLVLGIALSMRRTDD